MNPVFIYVATAQLYLSFLHFQLLNPELYGWRMPVIIFRPESMCSYSSYEFVDRIAK